MVTNWSKDWNLFFNTNKLIHLGFDTKFSTSYTVNGTPITSSSTHRDLKLGIIISSDLLWKVYYNSILAKAYCSLELLRRTFNSTVNIQARKFLYISLIMFYYIVLKYGILTFSMTLLY